jgi:hypothetical protein
MEWWGYGIVAGSILSQIIARETLLEKIRFAIEFLFNFGPLRDFDIMMELGWHDWTTLWIIFKYICWLNITIWVICGFPVKDEVNIFVGLLMSFMIYFLIGVFA